MRAVYVTHSARIMHPTWSMRIPHQRSIRQSMCCNESAGNLWGSKGLRSAAVVLAQIIMQPGDEELRRQMHFQMLLVRVQRLRELHDEVANLPPPHSEGERDLLRRAEEEIREVEIRLLVAALMLTREDG